MTKNPSSPLTTNINKGYITEKNHYNQLIGIFGKDYVSDPKHSARGSDFIIHLDDKVVTFESKTNVTDRFEAGSVGCWANGLIFSGSNFLNSDHIDAMQSLIKSNSNTVEGYCDFVGSEKIPHRISLEKYNDAKTAKKLIHISSSNILDNVIESTLIKSNNDFVKANYVIIEDNIYVVSENPRYDTLNLADKGAYVLSNKDVSSCSIRSARNSSSSNGLVSVTMRMQFNLSSNLPKSNVTLDNLKEFI